MRSVQRDPRNGLCPALNRRLWMDLHETVPSDCSYRVMSLFSIWGGVQRCHQNLKVATDPKSVKGHLVRTGCGCSPQGWGPVPALGSALPSCLAVLVLWPSPPARQSLPATTTSQLTRDSHLVPLSRLLLRWKRRPLLPHPPAPAVSVHPSGVPSSRPAPGTPASASPQQPQIGTT